MSKEMRQLINLTKNWDRHLNEEIDASEAYTDKGAIQTILDGKRNVGLVMLTPDEVEDLKQKGLNVIVVFPKNSDIRKQYVQSLSSGGWGKSGSEYFANKSHIIYSDQGKDDAFKLYDYMKSHRGFLSDQSPEQARYIGKLLGYTDESIDQYINKRYFSFN